MLDVFMNALAWTVINSEYCFVRYTHWKIVGLYCVLPRVCVPFNVKGKGYTCKFVDVALCCSNLTYYMTGVQFFGMLRLLFVQRPWCIVKTRAISLQACKKNISQSVAMLPTDNFENSLSDLCSLNCVYSKSCWWCTVIIISLNAYCVHLCTFKTQMKRQFQYPNCRVGSVQLKYIVCVVFCGMENGEWEIVTKQ
jgi:hypothetical protein